MEEFYGVQRETAGATPTMIRVIRICRKCGAKILSDAPEGLCTRCVLKIALAIAPDTSVAADDSSAVASAKADEPGWPTSPMPATSRDDVVPASKKKATYAAELLGELGDYELLEEVGRGG